jgi:hypothetical protein
MEDDLRSCGARKGAATGWRGTFEKLRSWSSPSQQQGLVNALPRGNPPGIEPRDALRRFMRSFVVEDKDKDGNGVQRQRLANAALVACRQPRFVGLRAH